MGLKKVTREPISEGPMDFMRGAAGATGAKIATAARNTGNAIKSTTQDIMAAGKDASAIGDFEQLVTKFAQVYKQYLQMKKTAGQGLETQEKPFMAKDGKGLQHTFDWFMSATHGEQLDEGVWDFVKGAGSAIGGKVRDKINQYAGSAGNTFRDIYKAGKEASAEGDRQKAEQRFAQVKSQSQALLKNVIEALKGFGPRGQQVLKNALANVPQDIRPYVFAVVARNAGMK